MQLNLSIASKNELKGIKGSKKNLLEICQLALKTIIYITEIKMQLAFAAEADKDQVC